MMTQHTRPTWHNIQQQTVLFLGMCALENQMMAMITSADTLSLPNKKITLLADRHGACEQGAQQLDHFMASLAKLSTPLHILIEQPPDLYYRYARTLGVLTGITKRIREGNVTSITTENIEIRPIAWAAYYILSRKKDDLIDPDARCNQQDEYSLKDITFQQVFDEFKSNITMLGEAFELTTHTGIQKNYFHFMQKATENLKLLQSLIRYHKIAIDSEILGYKQQINDTAVNDSLAKAILDTSSPLFELNIIHKTITSSHRALAIIAGYHHTSKITSMLLDAQAQHLYNAGGSPLSTTPITVLQFTTALTVQPRSPLIKYGVLPVACCLITVVAWYYYWIHTAAPTT